MVGVAQFKWWAWLNSSVGIGTKLEWLGVTVYSSNNSPSAMMDLW